MKKRASNIIGIVGTNNTGKTVIAEEIIKTFNIKRDKLNSTNYPSNYHRLVVFDVQDRLGHLLRKGDISIRIGDEGWEKMILGLRDSMVVFDDFKVLLEGDRISKDLLKVFGYRMEYGIDLIFIVWHPSLFPPSMHRFLDKYYLFRTNGSEKEFIDRLNGSKEDLINCKRLLDKEFLKYNETEYGALYPNFPFIYYDTGTNKSIKINFKNSNN